MRRKTLVLSLVVLTAALSACTQPSTPEDTTNPTVSLASLTSPVTTAGAVTLSAKASDDMGIRQVDFYLDDAPTPFASDTTADANQNYTASLNLTAAQNGKHTIRVVAVDTSGNRSPQASQTVTVNILTDTVNPTVSITGLPVTTVTAPATYQITLSASDNVGIASLRGTLTRQDAGGQSVTLFDQTTTNTSTFTVPLSVDASANGTYTLTVTAADTAGNSTTSTQTVTVNIPVSGTAPTPGRDTQAPSLSIDAPTLITAAGNYNVTVKVSDNVAVASVTGTVTSPLGTFPLGGLSTSGGTTSLPITSNFLNGQHSLTVTATDTSGNVTTKSTIITVNLP